MGAADDSQAQEGQTQEESKEPKKDGKPNMSMTSQGLNSSLMESSDDEAAKAKKEAEKGKKGSKGFSEKELNVEVNIELVETDTMIFFAVPGITGVHETPEYTEIHEENTKYETLLVNKKGSDSYEARGAQTMNSTMKAREVNCTDIHTFVEHPVWVQANPYDIMDASKLESISAAQRMTKEFYNSIHQTMTERMKDPRCLIDAEALASHVSIYSGDQSKKDPDSGAPIGKKPRKKKGGAEQSAKQSGDTSKVNAETSSMKQSESESATERVSDTSKSQTGAGQVSSDTMFKSAKVEYVDVELPVSILTAIRIIERLLTQSQFHEQHVLYKAYPSVNLEKAKSLDDEEEEEGGGKKRKAFGRQ